MQAGDAEAFGHLVDGYVRRARAIARRLLQDADDADDLVQDAFLRALERIGTFDPERPFGPWFFRLLVNSGVDRHRQRVRRGPVDQVDEVPLASAAPGPDEALEHEEIRQRFATALAALPPRQRVIVMAYEVDGSSTEEIADSLGVSRVTVRWHLHQGRQALRAALAVLRD